MRRARQSMEDRASVRDPRRGAGFPHVHVAAIWTTNHTAAMSHNARPKTADWERASSRTTDAVETRICIDAKRGLCNSRPENSGTKWSARPKIVRPRNPNSGRSVVHATRERTSRRPELPRPRAAVERRDDPTHTRKNRMPPTIATREAR